MWLVHGTIRHRSRSSTDGDYALKYFLVDKAKEHNGVDLAAGRRRFSSNTKSSPRMGSYRRAVMRECYSPRTEPVEKAELAPGFTGYRRPLQPSRPHFERRSGLRTSARPRCRRG